MNKILLNKPIAHGRTADIHDWDDDHILKLFHNWSDLENVKYELKIAQAVHASGVKAPAVGELIQVEGRNGLIYERVAGESMLTLLQRRPWMVFAYSRLLAQLHVQMHDNSFKANIPNQHSQLQYKINNADALPASMKISLLKALDSMPKGGRVCHGDFHPANVLLSENDANIIDWIDASCGNPLADVARTTIILIGAAETKQIPNLFLKMLIKIAHAAYLREYFRLRPNGMDEYRRWLSIVAGARLSEGMPELEQWLLQQAQKVNSSCQRT